jgi:hypothetical protein
MPISHAGQQGRIFAEQGDRSNYQGDSRGGNEASFHGVQTAAVADIKISILIIKTGSDI